MQLHCMSVQKLVHLSNITPPTGPMMAKLANNRLQPKITACLAPTFAAWKRNSDIALCRGTHHAKLLGAL